MLVVSYDLEVVNEKYWVWNFVLVVSFGCEIEFGEKQVFKLDDSQSFPVFSVISWYFEFTSKLRQQRKQEK